MITIDCKDVLPIRNDLVVYVSDQVAAIPTLKNREFTLSNLDDDEPIDMDTVITSIKQFLDSIGEGYNFAVISTSDVVSIKSVRGKTIEREPAPRSEMFTCTHCGFVTQYQVELNVHMRIHYFA